MTRNKFNSPIMSYPTLEAFLKDNPKYKNIITVTPVYDDNGEEIDPWGEHLNYIAENHIIEACRNSIWYFFKYVVRINGQTFGWSEPRVQFIWLYLHRQNAIWLAPRQIDGRSITLYSLIIYSYLFGSNFGRPQLLNSPGVRQIDDFYDSIELPDWMSGYKLAQNFIYQEHQIQPYREYLTKFNERFIDDLMFVTGCTFDNITSDYNSQMLTYGVGCLGLENADLIRHTLPFYTSMISADEDQNVINIRNFSNSFSSFMGYKPIFLILSEYDDHDIDPETMRWAENAMSGDTYRREILCKPDWMI